MWQYHLFAEAIADFAGIELDALVAHGYAKPTPDELARLAYIDANPRFVLTAVQLPAKTKTVSQLVSLGERGIRADDVAAIERYGYHPTLEQFIRLADVGIRPSYIARLRAAVTFGLTLAKPRGWASRIELVYDGSFNELNQPPFVTLAASVGYRWPAYELLVSGTNLTNVYDQRFINTSGGVLYGSFNGPPAATDSYPLQGAAFTISVARHF